MLPAYIIEELRRCEEARREQVRRPRLQLPIPVSPLSEKHEEHTTSERGVVVIELMR